MPISPEIMEETDDRTQENEVEAQKSREEEEDDEFGLDEEAEADREDNEEEENPAGEDQMAVESGPNRKKRYEWQAPWRLNSTFFKSTKGHQSRQSPVLSSARLTWKLISYVRIYPWLLEMPFSWLALRPNPS